MAYPQNHNHNQAGTTAEGVTWEHIEDVSTLPKQDKILEKKNTESDSKTGGAGSESQAQAQAGDMGAGGGKKSAVR